MIAYVLRYQEPVERGLPDPGTPSLPGDTQIRVSHPTVSAGTRTMTFVRQESVDDDPGTRCYSAFLRAEM
jgi:hypothetical protein